MASVLFGMFVLAVSCDQLNAIFTEETAVEAVQRKSRQQYKRARRRPRIALLAEVCGGGELSKIRTFETTLLKNCLKE